MNLDAQQEKSLSDLATLATQYGDGLFTVKIAAKRGGALVPTTLASFAGVSLEHLNNTEAWVPKVVGGGEYIIIAQHESKDALGKRIAFNVNFMGAPFSSVNIAATQAGDWVGPARLTSPLPDALQPVAPPASVPMQRFVTTVSAPSGIPATGAIAAAAQQLPPDAASQFIAVARSETAARAELDQRAADLRQRESELRIRADADAREAKHKAEMDALKLSLAARPEPVKPALDIGALFTGLGALLTPIVTQLVSSGNDLKKQQIEIQHRQMEMQARADADRSAQTIAAQQAHNALLLKLLEKPSGPNPELQMMMEMAKASTESQGAMMTRMVDAMGTVSKTSIAMIETIADMTAPPEGSPMLDAVKEGVKGLMALSGGVDKGARKSIEANQKVPAQVAASQAQRQPNQPTPAQLQAAHDRKVQVEQQAQRQQQAHAQAQQPAPVAQPPANVVQFPPKQVEVPPAQQVVDATPAFGDMPDGFDGVATKSAIDELEELVRAEHQPVAAVAHFLFNNLREPSIVGALTQAEGDPGILLTQRLGLPYIMAHADYLEALGVEINKQAEELGIAADDDEGTEKEPAAEGTEQAS